MKWTDAKIADEVTRCLSDVRPEMGTAMRAIRDDTIKEACKAVCPLCRKAVPHRFVGTCGAIRSHFRETT